MLPDCWFLFRIAGFVAGLLALLPDCWLYCRIAGFFAGLLARNQYPEGPATGHLGTGSLGFPESVYKRKLRWFRRLQVATACFSCSPPDLNFLVPYFIFTYMHNNHCHRVTAQLQLINIIITIYSVYTEDFYHFFHVRKTSEYF